MLQPENRSAPRSDSWRPGLLHPNLSWTHYRTLLRVEGTEARAFYEIEALKNNWSARELERQINSLLYERLALSRDKRGLLRLATKGHKIQKPIDVFKDPVVIEFLGLPESPRLVETELEQGLIDNLQSFLLELGKGFAFVSRQERVTLDSDAVVRYTLGRAQARKIFASRHKLHVPTVAELKKEIRRELALLKGGEAQR
ncbi:MAG: YhcG family protein [Candidatus Thermoplasmatota archaeon]